MLSNQNKEINIYLKIFLYVIIIVAFFFSIIFDLVLSDSNYPILFTIFFIIFISYRFIKPYIR